MIQVTPKINQDFTRFRTLFNKSVHTEKFRWSLKKKKLNEEKAPS